MLAGADAFSQARPLFTQHERQSNGTARPNSRCSPEPNETAVTYSDVTVFDNREVVYRTSTAVACLGDVGDPPFARRWEAPSSAADVFRTTLSAQELEQFRIFLDRVDVRGIRSFMNAGPGVGDFKITIARPAGTHTIDVTSLSPAHMQLVDDPTLIHVICRAKEMARRASRSGEVPDWCKNARPLAGLK